MIENNTEFLILFIKEITFGDLIFFTTLISSKKMYSKRINDEAIPYIFPILAIISRLFVPPILNLCVDIIYIKNNRK